MPWGVSSAVRVGRTSGRLLLWAWRAVRTSRLGTIGLVMVFVFAGLALLAPLISLHSRTFLAPHSDRFLASEYLTPTSAGHPFQLRAVCPTSAISGNTA